MRKMLDNRVEREVLSLIEGVAYASVPAWYGSVRRNLKMDLIVPKNRAGHAPMPLIIWICGGAFRCVSRSAWLPELMGFARRGYCVASIEYRTVNEGTYADSYADVKSAIRYLKAHAAEYCIDTGRIAVMGESAGGTMASFAGVAGHIREFDRGDYLEYDSSVHAVVDFYGIVDCTCNPIQADGRDIPPFMMEDFLGLDYSREDALRASPIAYINADTPPFLIFHGNRDNRVPFEQSVRLYEALRAAGVRADFYELDGADHGEDSFYQPEKLEIVDRFLREVLHIG